ncbi:MAG: class A beta-lactamase-related serine hydrolase, partial [Actinomycetota bacterium]|nr:class A beta-lactamase-related serine hydrolase [Actinomycetota bacterium]
RALAVSPGLRTVADLALPGGPGQVDSGVGVYPSLAAAERLVFPGPGALDRARRFARARQGEVAFAVADDRGGISGIDVHRPFQSASLSKAMILVAYLRKLAAEDGEPSQSDLLSLGYMIRLSDNASADTIYARVGDRALMDLARRAEMKGFAVSGDWANATVTPAGQARFFLAIDRLVPRRFRELARDLLESVSELQSWGIPVAARPRWRVFFKGGWRPDEDGEMVHQAALLEQGSRRVAIAVMTTAGPDMVYGERSIQGVSRLLLTGAPAALLPVQTAGAQPLRRLVSISGGR